MKNRYLLLLLLILIILSNCKKADDRKSITVSILPQKYFVEKIVGNKFKINVMVRPGHSPATYEPLPQQMQELTDSPLYFRIGVPFEEVWIKKIEKLNPEIKMIDTREGITLRDIETFEEKHHDSEEEHEHHGKDPHIWLSPALVKTQAATIYNAISGLDPENKTFYKKNLEAFLMELDDLLKELEIAFSKIENKNFFVFHPAWGYFADQFELKQLPIEIEGKEPSPKSLARIIEEARGANVKVIFVQKQFSTESAEAIAKSIGGAVVTIDPLSYDYTNNLKNVSKTIIKNIE